ncbi:hypothetical protein MtrunA17_Chr3g0082741 [Medicago truncatula]|uniref:Uncharacterized protein n=1 Tax=Medicago truncatula TaxID=3880 RepID=A0A396IP80_MEDTR|nr:hypothetical protein MtrunA17_Chr3g0082741 [Medicago truncatula]
MPFCSSQSQWIGVNSGGDDDKDEVGMIRGLFEIGTRKKMEGGVYWSF